MKKIRVAIVGFGGIARIHYNAYMALIEDGLPLEIVAICEKNKESVRKKVTINLGTDTLPVSDDIEIFGDVDELIEKADFDLADVCLPTFLHKNVSIKLLEAGKHVLCEKPMALSSADCLEMISAADTAKRGLMIAQCLRYEPCYLYLKECFEYEKEHEYDAYDPEVAKRIFADIEQFKEYAMDITVYQLPNNDMVVVVC